MMTGTGGCPPRIALLRLLPLVLALALPAGCMRTVTPANGPITSLGPHLQVNGVSYATPEAAVESMREKDEGWAEGVQHEADPIKGSVRIILPDADRLRPLVAQVFEQKLKRPVTGEALEFVVQGWQVGVRAAADALIKSGEFQSSSTVEQNDVADPPQGGAAYLVWYQVRTSLPNNMGLWIGHWLVRRAGSPAVQQATFDIGTAQGAPRYESFVKSIRQAALRLGGTSVAGVTSASPGVHIATGQGVTGSGIIIDTKGHILTNEHVVRSCGKAEVTDAAKESYEVKVIARDGANDLALLTATHHWSEAATLRAGHEPRPGDAVVVAGYPLSGLLGSGVIVTTGSLSALSGPRDDSRLIQLSAPIQPGNSGGPVLDASGRVLGIVSSSLNGVAFATFTGMLPQNVNFALKAAILRNFLDTNQIGYAEAAAGEEMSPGAVGDLARKFTVRIECRAGS
ncbi:MAG TPA: serine protease [Stellaceae bacterium]|nr:serine protease [Stellaceae bacterium]